MPIIGSWTAKPSPGAVPGNGPQIPGIGRQIPGRQSRSDVSAEGGRERQVGEDGGRGAGGGVADGVGREAGDGGDGFDEEAFIVPPDELLAFDEVTRLCCVLLLFLCFVAIFWEVLR